MFAYELSVKTLNDLLKTMVIAHAFYPVLQNSIFLSEAKDLRNKWSEWVVLLREALLMS